jgi:hypothetical protein
VAEGQYAALGASALKVQKNPQQRNLLLFPV